MTRDARRIVRVVSTKYDSALGDTYEAQLLDHAGSTVRLIVPAGTPICGRKIDRVVEAEDDGIEIYFTDRRYNLWHSHEHTTWPKSLVLECGSAGQLRWRRAALGRPGHRRPVLPGRLARSDG